MVLNLNWEHLKMKIDPFTGRGQVWVWNVLHLKLNVNDCFIVYSPESRYHKLGAMLKY